MSTKDKSNSKIPKEALDMIKKLESQVLALNTENTKMRIILENNELTGSVSKISDTEAICVEQIRKLKEASARGEFSETNAKVFDILYKNLRTVRGTPDGAENKKLKKLSSAELRDTLLKFEVN